MGEYADALIEDIERTRRWPPDSEQDRWTSIRLYRALRDSDTSYLRQHEGIDADKPYRVDPLAERIAEGFADLTWGEPPEITPASTDDADQLTELLGDEFAPELWEAEDLKVTEGEVWYRVFAGDPSGPIIEWHSRGGVIPRWRGRTLTTVAFVHRLAPKNKSERAVWRHLEIHEQGEITNWLYRGSESGLGGRRPLSDHPDVADLRESWEHGIDEILAGWIPNKRSGDRRSGRSTLHGIVDMLLELNQALSTGAENRKLTAKKRALVPDAIMGEDGKADLDDDVIVMERLDSGDAGGSQGSAFKVLEYSFDAESLIRYQNDLAIKACSRVGMTAHFIGVPTEDGYAESGVSLRMRLIPTNATARAQMSGTLRELPKAVRKLMLVAELPVDQGGIGASWKNASDPPTIAPTPSLPEDPVETVQRVSEAVTSGVMSRKTAVREQHRDWTDDDVDEELDLIAKDEGSGAAAGGVATTSGGLPTIFAERLTSSGEQQNVADAQVPDGGQPSPGV